MRKDNTRSKEMGSSVREPVTEEDIPVSGKAGSSRVAGQKKSKYGRRVSGSAVGNGGGRKRSSRSVTSSGPEGSNGDGGGGRGGDRERKTPLTPQGRRMGEAGSSATGGEVNFRDRGITSPNLHKFFPNTPGRTQYLSPDDTRSSECASNGTVGITDATLHVWDTPGKYRSLSGTPCASDGSSSMGASAGSAAAGIDSPKFSPLSAITAADYSHYHMGQADLLTPGDIASGKSNGVQRHEEDYMDISSAARDLRELSQMTVDERVGPGRARAPSSAEMGRSRSGGFKDERLREGSVIPKRKLEDLVATPNARSRGIEADVDRFFASGSLKGSSSCGNVGSGGYKVRDARAGGDAAFTPVIKRRAIIYDRSPHRHDHDASYSDTRATPADASVLLAFRFSDRPRRTGGVGRDAGSLQPR